jgi:hypothetical protein
MYTSIINLLHAVTVLAHRFACPALLHIHPTVLLISITRLRSLALPNPNSALVVDALRPEPIDEELSKPSEQPDQKKREKSLPRLATVMSNKQPETENALRQDIVDCPGDRFGVHADAVAERGRSEDT